VSDRPWIGVGPRWLVGGVCDEHEQRLLIGVVVERRRATARFHSAHLLCHVTHATLSVYDNSNSLIQRFNAVLLRDCFVDEMAGHSS